MEDDCFDKAITKIVTVIIFVGAVTGLSYFVGNRVCSSPTFAAAQIGEALKDRDQALFSEFVETREVAKNALKSILCSKARNHFCDDRQVNSLTIQIENLAKDRASSNEGSSVKAQFFYFLLQWPTFRQLGAQWSDAITDHQLAQKGAMSVAVMNAIQNHPEARIAKLLLPNPSPLTLSTALQYYGFTPANFRGFESSTQYLDPPSKIYRLYTNLVTAKFFLPRLNREIGVQLQLDKNGCDRSFLVSSPRLSAYDNSAPLLLDRIVNIDELLSQLEPGFSQDLRSALETTATTSCDYCAHPMASSWAN